MSTMNPTAIPKTIREEISDYLGNQPKPYVVPSLEGGAETGCECWDLPPVKEEDKPPHVRYQEIAARITNLMEENLQDEGIEALKKEANELIKGLPVAHKFGAAFVSMDELLKLDPRKGIRKERCELRGRFMEQDVRLFLGYQAGNADTLIAMPNADPYEFLRIHETRGNNHAVGTEAIIAALRQLDNEPGIAIVTAAADSVEFVFERPVEAGSRSKIRRRLSRLCPSAEGLTEGIRLGRVALWWD